MRYFIAAAVICLVTVNPATAQKTTTIECIEAPELCKCEAFPLACIGSSAQVTRKGSGRVQVTPTGLLGDTAKTWRCEDLSYNTCVKFGCKNCPKQ